MDGFRLPPVIEEVLDSSDELCELKTEQPTMLADTLTAKERESLEEKEETVGDGEKGQQEEEKEVKEEKSEDEEQGGAKSEEEEVEDLRAQVIQLLLELEETREVSQRNEESFMELQGLLEEERLASAHQAESFTRQIQRLQGGRAASCPLRLQNTHRHTLCLSPAAQLRSVQEEMDSLEVEKESELEEVQQELRSAQEEVLVLQQAAEEAAAERENDIASLQEELCRLRAELQRLYATTAEYELEITTLRAEMSMKHRNSMPPGDVTQLQEEVVSLTDERQTLTTNNQQLSNKVEQLQQQRDERDDMYLAVRGEGGTEHQRDVQMKVDTYITLSQSEHQDLDSCSVQKDICSSELNVLKVQLRQAEETSQKVQRECDGLKDELAELQQLYGRSQRERTVLEQELQCCKAELQRLVGRKSQSSAEGWNLAVVAVALAAIAVLVVPSFTRK
ncbi:coiled-coil domain-containing protein 136-like isoform X2 [Parambassis ranga]|uniref:Coiled-coil domain-containing protein 136-like isoform X2 n=1 Tax=Parambassis ranga TaxID=210632 RepID=A0A6P7H7S6_9TELE|nr:coiled-coil domain-containing protein 136-like isoform X2 [Parambassis ranga]